MRFTSLTRFAVLVMLLSLLIPSILLAQNIITGAVNGTVTDPTGAIVVGADVNLKSNETGEVHTVKTNSAGSYTFPLLKPGAYSLTIAHPGFSTYATNVQVQLGQTALANVELLDKHYEAAIATCRTVHSRPHQSYALIHYIAARAYEHESRLSEAAAEFETFLQEEPSGARADAVRKELAAIQAHLAK